MSIGQCLNLPDEVESTLAILTFALLGPEEDDAEGASTEIVSSECIVELGCWRGSVSVLCVATVPLQYSTVADSY